MATSLRYASDVLKCRGGGAREIQMLSLPPGDGVNEPGCQLCSSGVDVELRAELGQVGHDQLAAVPDLPDERLEEDDGGAFGGGGAHARGLARGEHVQVDGQVDVVARG